MARRGVRRNRAVDVAMREGRPDKHKVRSLWLERVQYFHERLAAPNVLYLTLCGAEAFDIELLVDKQILELTETGAITAETVDRIVAVENSPRAVAALRAKFPGLRVIDQSVGNLVRGENAIRFPTGKEEQYCRARVVNLDLNSCLLGTASGGVIEFEELSWIRKLGELHCNQERLEWTLCLTLHGEIQWDEPTAAHVKRFLLDNFQLSPDFEASSARFLGGDLLRLLKEGTADGLLRLTRDAQQKLLMVFVPKKIVELTQGQGWKIETQENLRYGSPPNAPIVTWIMHFTNDQEFGGVQGPLYRANIAKVLAATGLIDVNGNVIRD